VPHGTNAARPSLHNVEKSLLKRCLNRILHKLVRMAPGATTVRPFLHRLRGVRISGQVFIGDEVYLENEFPECLEMHHQSGIGLRSTVVAHFREDTGRIVILQKARIAACCTIVASPGTVLTIGEGSFVAAGSLVKGDVPPYTLVAGVPATPVASITVPAVPGVSYQAFKEGLRPLTDKPLDFIKDTTTLELVCEGDPAGWTS